MTAGPPAALSDEGLRALIAQVECRLDAPDLDGADADALRLLLSGYTAAVQHLRADVQDTAARIEAAGTAVEDARKHAGGAEGLPARVDAAADAARPPAAKAP
jgi:hypothetical protein